MVFFITNIMPIINVNARVFVVSNVLSDLLSLISEAIGQIVETFVVSLGEK